MGVALVPLDTLLAESDVISIHLPRNPETLGLLGEKELAQVKPGVLIVNAARGGLVDEAALADAVRAGRVGGAGIDVFTSEPTTRSPLFGLPNVVVTPHLGASTAEAQEKAGLAVARSVRLALAGDFVPDAVNVQAAGAVAEEVRPFLPLAESLGQVFTGLAEGAPAAVTVEARGEIAAFDVDVLRLAALKGLFSGVVEAPVTYVNAPLFAKERGIDVALVATEESADFRSVVSVRGVRADGTPHSVSGTLIGYRQVAKITEIDGYEVEVRPEAHLALLTYEDRPGVVGTIGAILGSAGVNIATAQVGRTFAGGEALMALSLDSAVPADVLSQIAREIGAHTARSVSLATG
jgi:D-3-phosphoglycerate dehydrogenase